MIPVSPMLSELAEAWLAAMIRASWQGGIALGLVWAVCRCLPRLPPRYRCWLWRLALLKLLVAALVATTIDLAVLPSSWTGGPFGGVWRSPPPAASPQAVLPVSAAGAEPETLGDVPLKAADAPGVSDPEGVSTAAASTASRIPVILFLLWLAALLGLVGLVARRIVAARRWRRQCVLVKDPLILAMGEGLARQFGLVQPPLLFAADFCRSPVVFGTMRTAIVLPASLMARVTAAEMRLILAHEMAHIRRGDLLGNSPLGLGGVSRDTPVAGDGLR
jgi:bla regulator protein BlaR1